jgi:CHAP domain
MSTKTKPATTKDGAGKREAAQAPPVTRVLHLTSPLMTGDDVLAAQRALRPYRPGPVDGEYGPLTAAATKRAKWALGYEQKDITGYYGEKLHAFLTDDAKPTADMKKLAKEREREREKEEKSGSLRSRMIAIAKAEVGTKEHPSGTNRVRYSAWYSDEAGASDFAVSPWCAMFVTWCASKAGSTVVNPRDARWAYCPFVVDAARHARDGLSLVSRDDVEPGDLVLFDWDGDHVADHIGLVEARGSGGTFTTIEGNTSTTSQNNGGEVMRRERDTDVVVCFARISR